MKGIFNRKNIIFLSIFIILFIVLTLVFNSEKYTNKNDEIVRIESIDFNLEKLNLDITDGYQLETTIKPIDAEERIIYISSDDNVLTVNNSGYIIARNVGKATVTAVTETGVSKSVDVVIEDNNYVNSGVIKIKDITINEQELTIEQGQSKSLNFNVYPSDANQKVVFDSSNENVASVDENGVIYAKKPGIVEITVSSNNKIYDRVTIYVNQKNIDLSEIILSTNNLNMKIGDTYPISVTYIPGNATNKKVSFHSNNKNIVTVDSNGLITAKGVGQTTVIVFSENKSATIQVNVEKENIIKPNEVTDIYFEFSNLEMIAGDTKTLITKIIPNVNTNLSWASSNNDVATVDSKGLVTALKEGKAVITVTTTNNKKASINITVKKKEIVVLEPTEVILNLTSTTMKPFETKKLKATVLPLNVETNITWISSNESVVSVDSNGLIKAKNVGNAQVAAITSNGKVARINVVVNYATISKEFASSSYGLKSKMDSSELDLINEHLEYYMDLVEDEYGNTLSDERSRTIAAAYFLAFNPYYLVMYDEDGDDITKGWDSNWSTAKSGSSKPKSGLNSESFMMWAIYQGTGTLYELEPINIYPIRNAVDQDDDNFRGVDVETLIDCSKPGDLLYNDVDDKYAMVLSVNDREVTLIQGYDGSFYTSIHKNGKTVDYNILYAMRNVYGDI